MVMNRGLRTLMAVVLWPMVWACQSGQQPAAYQLGELHFKATGKEEAQPAFKKGILLLHSFEYVDAAEAFREAIKIDPGFVMAYWGEAMTCIHPLWQEQDLDKGRAILNELAPNPEARLAKAATQFEKDLMDGVHILFGAGNKAVRDSSYAVYMGKLYRKYPGNDEIACFYSLSLISWAITGAQMSVSEKAAAVALEVVARNPNHPGALHYVIHAWDHPAYAAKALETANKYARVAPDAGHALHMPTHTYLALGMWDKVISSNEVSWAAEMARRDRKKLTNDALGYHSYHWLQYGLLQSGQKERARAMVDSMRKYCAAKPSPKARGHMVMLQTTYLAETQDYSPETMAMDYASNDLNVGLRAAQQFVKGMYAYQQGDGASLDVIIRQMAGERLVEADRMGDGGLRLCGNINRSLPTASNLKESEAMEAQLKAMRAILNKDDALAEQWLKTSTQLQEEVGYAYGPPNIVKPAFEMYGEWLLQHGRPQEAIAQFDKSLQFAPNRLLSLKGRQQSEEALRDAAMVISK